MSVAKVFVVTQNEYDLIEDFLSYHTAIFGPENVIVIDNKSTDKRVHDVYEKYSLRGVKVILDERAFAHGGHGRIMTDHILENIHGCDWVIPLDTDEFLVTQSVFESANAPSLSEVSELITKRLQSVDPSVTALRVVTTYESCINSPSVDTCENIMPARTVTTFTKCDKTTGGYKTMFRSNAFVSVCCGNHDGSTSYGRIENDPLLAHVHYHLTGTQRMFERAKNLISGIKMCNVELPDEQQVPALQRWVHNQLPAFHRAMQYLKIILRRIVYDLYVQGKKQVPNPQELDCFVEANALTPLHNILITFPQRDRTIPIDNDHKRSVVFAEVRQYECNTCSDILKRLLHQTYV